MNTKIVMSLSSIFMAVIGVSTIFIPHEILSFTELPTNYPVPLLVQLLGAMYFAFAILNWLAKGSVLGGIYGKPITMGNFAHFLIASLAIIKGVNYDSGSPALWVIVIMYPIFAICFGYIAFSSPVASRK